MPHAGRGVEQRQRGMEFRRAPAQRAQLPHGVVVIARLAQRPPVERGDLVTADDQGVVGDHRRRFQDREAQRGLFGRLACERLLVDSGRRYLETQAQALELAPGVLVNAIAPGPILPPAGIKNEEVKNISKVTPLKKWGGPNEIAKAVLFLCDTDFVTGECVRVDGGRHLY